MPVEFFLGFWRFRALIHKLSTREAVRVNAMLRAQGLAVLDPALSCFTMGGGGPRCMTCPLPRQDTP